ncbi:rod shape-determining protein RodA [Paenibacillus sambharensis]|uniref:Rod shape-determining protein RodA n=1 Tax=Paenibacillus sambharensis TaxID=1803190 RepID=A0A2W1L879_9BACL|nr:FtsW/RodA/SpoVE family cell cycle protein [Paenibacillus sambharensis]PZD95029.1 rod shape-determining protein RodA [Paenibacillus sambharensis]
MKILAKRLDYPIILILICFMAISTLAIKSSTMGTRYEGLHVNNMVMYAVLLIPVIIIACLDYRLIVRYFSTALYVLGVGLLVFVHFNGMNLNGSTRWISLGPVQFQPSEVVKIFVILMIASMLTKRNGAPLQIIKDIVPISIITLIPVLLILMQPDLGTSIVYFGILAGLLLLGNMRWIHVAISTATLAITTALLVWLYEANHAFLSKIVKPHQLSRIQAFIDPASDPDKSWHVLNSIRAISTGELFGKGYRQGFIVQNGFIPYDYADSIFVVIGEEFGFMGSAMLLILYFLLMYRMVRIAHDSSDISGTYIVVGVMSMLILQIVENIAMHMGLMPLTGIALPFISYGGSSLLTNMVAVGLVLSVRIHQSPAS